MHANRVLLLAVAVACICFGSPAMADIIYNLDANLDPFQEVPPHNTPGYGSADTTLDFTTGVFSITAGTGLYADLLAGATTVRLQDAAVGANWSDHLAAEPRHAGQHLRYLFRLGVSAVDRWRK